MKSNSEPDVITTLTTEFVRNLPVTEDPYHEEAAIKFIIREFAWALLARFPNYKYEIADQSGTMGEAVQAAKEENA